MRFALRIGRHRNSLRAEKQLIHPAPNPRRLLHMLSSTVAPALLYPLPSSGRTSLLAMQLSFQWSDGCYGSLRSLSGKQQAKSLFESR